VNRNKEKSWWRIGGFCLPRKRSTKLLTKQQYLGNRQSPKIHKRGRRRQNKQRTTAAPLSVVGQNNRFVNKKVRGWLVAEKTNLLYYIKTCIPIIKTQQTR
jgi:hypothetical protein